MENKEVIHLLKIAEGNVAVCGTAEYPSAKVSLYIDQVTCKGCISEYEKTHNHKKEV